MLNSTSLWRLPPTPLERQLGRHLRAPDGDHGDPPPADPSLITDPNPPAEPPAEPPKEPVEPPKPPEPPKEPPAAVEPLTVENLTVPEGFELQPELSDKFLEILNDTNMSAQDRANALIALHGETLSAASEAGSKAWDDMQTEWKDAAKADPDIGGAKLQSTLTGIGKLLDEFGDKEVRSVFDLTGAGNNVHMIKFLDKIANALTEGNYFTAGSPGGNDDPHAGAKRMYPSATDSKG